MKTKDFYYHLPPELIAQTPLSDRSASRLMVLNRKSGSIEGRKFMDITEYLNPGDVLVRNTTRVIPARIHGIKRETGGKMEFLLHKRLDANTFEALLRPAKRAKPDDIFYVNGELSVRVGADLGEGNKRVTLLYGGVFEEILDRAGETPLPPYITRALDDKERYQTVYSRENGSAAAPTAGLHFTPELIEEIRKKGVFVADVLLHVGLGTFRPVSVENIEQHKMHSEYYSVSQEAADMINGAKSAGGRIIAVGTTSSRTLESVADENGKILAGTGWTDIFISPGYRYKATDALITNFHLPESTLLMLVSALAGREMIFSAYSLAVEEKYRFFSFGDAMLII